MSGQLSRATRLSLDNCPVRRDLIAYSRSEKDSIVEKAEKRNVDQKTFNEELLKANNGYSEAKVTRRYL